MQNPYSYGVQADDSNKDYDQFEIVEMYYDGQVTTIAGGIVIRNDVNPFAHKDHPYASVITCPDPTDFDGIGTIAPIANLQDELNDIENAKLDYITRTLLPINKVALSEQDTYKGWIVKSNAVWLMNDIKNGHEFDRLPAMPPEAFASSGEINNRIDVTNGLIDFVRGTNPQASGSATQSSILAQAADNRLKLKLYSLQQSLKRLVSLDIKNIQEFVDEEFVVRLTERPNTFKKFSRAEIQGEFDIFPAGVVEIVSKDTKRAQLINLLATINNPMLISKIATEGKMLELAPVLKQIFETFEAKELETIIVDLPPAPPAPVAPMGAAPGGMPGGARVPNPANSQEMLKGVAQAEAPTPSAGGF